jgi:hypothetical protein
MQRDVATKDQKDQNETPGVIDTIAEGLSLALVRPLLFLLPMLLDLYFWIGPKVTLTALTEPISTWIRDSDASSSVDVADQLDRLGRSDATWLLATFVPSLLSEAPRSDVYELRARSLLNSGSWWLDVPLLIALVLAAGLVLMMYLVPIADAAIARRRSPGQIVSAVGIAWMRFMGLLVLLLAIAMLLLGPLAIASAILLVLGMNITPLLTLVAALMVMFGYLILWFAPDAIVVSQVGPVTAIKYSYAIIRGYFWQSVGLAAASLLITIGLGEIWQRLADQPPGLLLGVIANAFFATGLAVASMTFYANRIPKLIPGSIQVDSQNA